MGHKFYEGGDLLDHPLPMSSLYERPVCATTWFSVKIPEGEKGQIDAFYILDAVRVRTD